MAYGYIYMLRFYLRNILCSFFNRYSRVNIRITLGHVISSMWFKLLISITIIGMLLFYNRIDFSVLASLSTNWFLIVFAFLLMLPPFLIVSYRFKLLLSSQNINVSFLLALRWTMIGSFFDLTMPSSNGGDIVKAGYVVKHIRPGLRIRSVMAVAFDRVIGLLGLFILASIVNVLGWVYLSDLPARHYLLAISLILGFVPIIFLLIVGKIRIYKIPKVNIWLSNRQWGVRLIQVFVSFSYLQGKPMILFVALLLSVINHLFWCTTLVLITSALGDNISLLKGFVVFPLAISGGVVGIAGGFGGGTVIFDLLFTKLLLIQNGALIGLVFQTLGLLSRLFGLPFYLSKKAY